MLYLFFATVIRLTLSLMGGTMVGAIIPILIGGAGVWILAYVAGQLASQIQASRMPKALH